MATFFIYLVVLWVVNAWHDADYYNKVNTHISGAALACMIVLGLFLMPIKNADYIDYINLVIVSLSFRWIVFDISYNLMIKQKWYYVGTTSKLDKWLGNWSFIFKTFFIFLDFPIIYLYLK